jgi:hypothetical protein
MVLRLREGSVFFQFKEPSPDLTYLLAYQWFKSAVCTSETRLLIVRYIYCTLHVYIYCTLHFMYPACLFFLIYIVPAGGVETCLNV